ncbi:MAG: glycosyltransferase family 4 protein [Prevotella sp.]|nr:glycosyltransferase family 4 protein [Prevotella sp.]MBO5626921.1 glycosyltransferase family 4 protein [Prevotella sp.]
MNVFIEVYTIKHPYVGVGEFCLNLGRHLALRAKDLRTSGIQLVFIVPRGKEGIFGNDVSYISFPGNIGGIERLCFKSVDLLHLTHQYCKFIHFPRVKNTLLTIHDINFIYEKRGAKLKRYTRKFEDLLQKADYVNYISKFAKQDTESHFAVNKPSKVIYNGVSKQYYNETNISDDFKRLIPASYFFHISSLRPKKNIHLLIEMASILPEETFVIAGDWNNCYAQAQQEIIKRKNLQNIVCLTNVSSEEKGWLYAHCKAFLFPSACEGFGLPPVEAMQLGKPVFLSTFTSLPEIGGKLAFFWDNLDPHEMAQVVREKMRLFSNTPGYANALQTYASQFNWDTCADSYIRYYKGIALGSSSKEI